VFNLKIPIQYVIIISAVSYLFLHQMHDPNWDTLVEGSFDVANRTPHWRVNQSRLMGPVILKLMTIFGIVSEQWALRFFSTFFIALNNYLLAICISNLTNSKYQILNTLIIFNAFFIVSQDVWLFAWDFIDITFFIFYGFVLFKDDYLKYLIPINFLHIFNRESALIMAVFFLFVLLFENKNNIFILIKDKLFLGLIFNLSFGLIYTYFSRRLLFIRQSDLTGGGQDLDNNFLGGNFVTPMLNYSQLFNGETVANTLIIISLLTVFFVLIKNFKEYDFIQKKLAVGVVVNILPIFIFGIFTETRQYFPAIVLLTYLIFSNSAKSNLNN